MSRINHIGSSLPLIADQWKIRFGGALAVLRQAFGAGHTPPSPGEGHPQNQPRPANHLLLCCACPAGEKNRETKQFLREREGAGRIAGAGNGKAGHRARSAVAGLALVLGLVAGAAAHSWYPWECCSSRDCFLMRVDDVRTVQGGWQLADGTFIAWREARPSPDGQFHACRREDGRGELIRLPEKPACFWAPMGAS